MTKPKIVHTIISSKIVDEYGEQGVDELPDFTVGHVLLSTMSGRLLAELPDLYERY